METKLKVFLVILLSAISFSAFAYHHCRHHYRYYRYYTCPEPIYLGNQNRLDTVWQPPHCGPDGCWREGYYIKFLGQPTCRDVTWVDGCYDRAGNWIGPHFRVNRYVVVNPGSEQSYPGFPI